MFKVNESRIPFDMLHDGGRLVIKAAAGLPTDSWSPTAPRQSRVSLHTFIELSLLPTPWQFHGPENGLHQRAAAPAALAPRWSSPFKSEASMSSPRAATD